jgi:alkyl sulfatase BDS1-like metallo-beta-lactamase superfamily hydrolase
MTVDLLVDLLGVRLNGPRAERLELDVNLVISDRDGDLWTFGARHGVIHARHGVRSTSALVEIESTIESFSAFASGSKSLEELLGTDGFRATGELALLAQFVESLDVFDFGFEIVLP